jgi:hypothetical protein
MGQVFLVKENGAVRAFYSEHKMKLAGYDKADKTVTDEEFNGKGGYARILGGEIVTGRTDAEREKDEAEAEARSVKAEISNRDYRALKAVKLGADLEKIYPGEREWYQSKITRLNELEILLGAK